MADTRVSSLTLMFALDEVGDVEALGNSVATAMPTAADGNAVF